VKSAHFREDNKECLVVRDSTGYRTFVFDAGVWKLGDTIPFESTGDTFPVSAWTVGDINNDSRDEIVSVAGHTFITYSWNGKSFIPKKQRLPYFVDDIVVGDIDHDGHNELVMLTYTRPFADTFQWDFYNVVIGRYTAAGFLQLWDDNRELKIARCGPVPSDHLVCIADVMSVGHNQLLCAGGQSDVSATIYLVFEWSGKGLARVNQFVVEDGKLILNPSADDPRDYEHGSSIGNWIPAETGGENVFLIPWFDDRGGLEKADVLARISEGRLEAADTLPRPAGPDFNTFWIDPDGRGKGVLDLPDDIDTDSFRFYREKGTDRKP
jgi:hypothetical protein